MPELRVFQFLAEVGGAPVAAADHLPRHKVIDIQTLRQLLLGDGCQQQNGLHIEGRQFVQRRLPFPPDDHEGGGVGEGSENQVGIKGELPDVRQLFRKVALLGDGPRHEAGHFAEIDAGEPVCENLLYRYALARVLQLDEGLVLLYEPVVEFVQGDLVVNVVIHEICPRALDGQGSGIGFVVRKVERLRQAVHEVADIFGGGVGQQDDDVGDVAVKADLMVFGLYVVGEFGADAADGVAVEVGGGFGKEQQAAAVGKRGEPDGLEVHPEVAAEVVVDAVLQPVSLSGGDVNLLIGDEFGFRLKDFLYQRNFKIVLFCGKKKNDSGNDKSRNGGENDEPFFQCRWILESGCKGTSFLSPLSFFSPKNPGRFMDLLKEKIITILFSVIKNFYFDGITFENACIFAVVLIH